MAALRRWRGDTTATFGQLQAALASAPGLAAALSPWPAPAAGGTTDPLPTGLPAGLLAPAQSVLDAAGTVLFAAEHAVVPGGEAAGARQGGELLDDLR
eukprot:SAG22_NODE_10116_length_552_cov_0.799117_1_plen_97_part_10